MGFPSTQEIINRVPCGILKLFGAESERCRVVAPSANAGAITQNQYDAFAFYDNLASERSQTHCDEPPPNVGS